MTVFVFYRTSKKPLESILIGASARSVAAVTMLPFTVLKTRYEVSDWKLEDHIVYTDRGVATSYIYAKMVRTHLGQKYGRFYHSSDGVLILCV